MSWILLAIFSAVFASLVAVFGKLGLKNIDSTLATTVRVIIMSVFFVLVSFALQKFKLIQTLDRRAIVYIILSAVAGGLSWLCYFGALKNGPATAVAALDRLSIVFILILSIFFLGEGLTIKTALGTLLIVGGAMLFIL